MVNFYEEAGKELKMVEKDIASMLESEPQDIYGMLLPYIKRGGKRVRPILTVLACRAFGGDAKKAIRPAAITEMFHNFTLIHDDICDNSQFRRGEKTLHIEYGLPIALNSGDALYTLIWEKIVGLEVGPKKLLEMQKLYVAAFKRVADGQGTELMWYKKGRFDITERQYLDMIGGKTAALLGLSCELGAYLAGAGKKEMDGMRNFGECIGKAFQIQDDVLNVTGNFEKYQKEIGGDIREGKRTLMLIDAMKKADAQERKKMVEVLSSGRASEAEIGGCIAIFKKYGSIEYAQETAQGLVNAAKKELEALKEGREKDALLNLTDYIVNRET